MILRSLLGAMLCSVMLAGCKIEPVGEMSPVSEPEQVEGWFSEWGAEKIVDEEASLVEAELRRQMSLLTTAALQGRRPGTEGAGLTASHLERTMHEIGLSPAGVGGGWRQPVVVRIRNTDDGRLEFPAADGEGEPVVLRHGEGLVLWREDVAGMWDDEDKIVDAGWGISAPELGHDDYAGLDVKGQVVLVRAGVPPDAGFDEARTAMYSERDRKLARARLAGAVGCILATGILQADPAWAQLVAEHRLPRVAASGTVVQDKSPPPLVGLLSAEAEAATRAWLLAIAATEEAVPTFKASVTTTERTVVDPNIVGRIPGEERPQEVIIVMAHWDAGGTSAPLADGGGAIDNASGVAALLAMARKSTDWVRRGRFPDRSIAFVATASDSLDLAGTRAMLSAGPLRRSDIVAVIALDALSAKPAAAALAALGGEATTLGARLRTLRPSIRSLDSALTDDLLTASHRPVLEGGIPAITLTRHDPDAPVEDVYDPTASTEDLREDVSLVFELVWAYAESIDRPEVVVEPASEPTEPTEPAEPAKPEEPAAPGEPAGSDPAAPDDPAAE